MLVEGSTFAAYEVRRRIAVGGMGEVYLCRHRILDRLDAVKVLRPHLATNADFRRRFLREALSAARLRHPHVVTVYTADEADGLLFLAMEYVAADDLATLLARDPAMEPDRVVRLLRGVADALDAAHRVHLVHRDIKPSNLLVTNAGTPQESVTLVDFGISRILDSDAEITRTGEIVGTIAYCAPEQLSRVTVGAAVDQYALACVAYECLTGQVPFPREGQLAVMTAHLTAPPPRVSALRADLPAAADAVVGRAMAKEPGDRYPTCGQFVAALSTVLAQTDYPDPARLAELLRSGRDLVRPAGHEGTLTMRVGRSAHGALVVPFTAGACVIRGEAVITAASVRWLVAQTVARHRDRDVCLVAAIEPAPDESWLWLNWLPHARPSNPPIAGPHVANTPDSAADLVTRLRALVAGRRLYPAAGPRVLALLDRRLGVSPDDPDLVGAEQFGVHVLHLIRPADRVASSMSTLDLSADLSAAWWRRPGGALVEGVADTVDTGYVRELVDLLPD